MRIQLSLSFHLYLLYLLSNSCGGNDAFWRHSVLMKQSSSSADLCPAKQSGPKPGRLQNLRTDAGMCVHCARHLFATPATWNSASLTHGQAYHKTSKRHWWSSRSMESTVMYRNEGKRTSLWTSSELKWLFLRASTLHNRLFLFRATNSLPRKTCCFASVPLQLFKSK